MRLFPALGTIGDSSIESLSGQANDRGMCRAVESDAPLIFSLSILLSAWYQFPPELSLTATIT